MKRLVIFSMKNLVERNFLSEPNYTQCNKTIFYRKLALKNWANIRLPTQHDVTYWCQSCQGTFSVCAMASKSDILVFFGGGGLWF